MRTKGEGSIYRAAGSGLWCAAVVVDGKRRIIRSKKQDVVRDKLRDFNRQLAEGLPVPSRDVTVEAFMGEWLEAQKSTLKMLTWEGYERYIRLHILPSIGRFRLTKLDRRHIQRLYALKVEEGLAPQSIHHIEAILHKALSDGMRWGRVYRNVSELVNPPRVPHREMRALNFDEAARFLQIAGKDRLQALYVLAIGTGMRRGELLALHWRDVSLTGGYVSVNWTLNRSRGGGLTCDEPKTKKSRRRVDLEVGCVEALRNHGRVQREERLRAGPLWDETDLVFTNEVGRAIEPTNMLVRSFWPIRDKAGFPELRFHDLRHTAATLMLEAGVDLKRVSERLGHSTINITADRYLHVTPAMDRAAADAVGRLLRAARSDLAHGS